MALSTIDTSSIGGLGYGFKNRIINGGMVIDQRNAGASATYGSGSTAGNYYGYNIDRWFAQSYSSTVGNGAAFTVQQNAGSVTPPAGYKNYLGVTVTSAQATLQTDSLYRILQLVEGYNTIDFAFGSSAASSITLSFWVRSSVTGTFSGTVNNNGNGGTVTRYLYTYTVNVANTWEYKTIVIPAATTGSWGTVNSYGVTAEWCFGAASGRLGTPNVWGTGDQQGATGTTNLMATNGATFYITGVQLEAGTVATSFDWRPYGTELALCQRYAYMMTSVGSAGTYLRFCYGETLTTSQLQADIVFPVEMRSYPSLTTTGTAASYGVYSKAALTALSTVPTVGDSVNRNIATVVCTVATTPFTVGSCGTLIAANNQTAYMLFTAEL